MILTAEIIPNQCLSNQISWFYVFFSGKLSQSCGVRNVIFVTCSCHTKYFLPEDVLCVGQCDSLVPHVCLCPPDLRKLAWVKNEKMSEKMWCCNVSLQTSDTSVNPYIHVLYIGLCVLVFCMHISTYFYSIKVDYINMQFWYGNAYRMHLKDHQYLDFASLFPFDFISGKLGPLLKRKNTFALSHLAREEDGSLYWLWTTLSCLA